MTTPKVAKNVKVVRAPGTGKSQIYIDDEPFPYFTRRSIEKDEPALPNGLHPNEHRYITVVIFVEGPIEYVEGPVELFKVTEGE